MAAMLRTLALHPDSSCAALRALDVRIARSSAALDLCFAAVGAIAELRVPGLAAAGRADGLWRSTCFEAFVQAAGGPAYHEFNFAPSGQWAAYAFDGRREGMRPAELAAAPEIRVAATPERLELRARLDLTGLPGLAPAASWRLGLSAVIEEIGGGVSYWALAHPSGRPDFHHPDGFALQLPAMETP